MVMIESYIIVTALVLLGMAFGSFVNALVWRIHWHSENVEAAERKAVVKKNKTQQAEDDRYSMVKGRSMCEHCKHELAPKDLVPFFSWLYLGGKCRYCKKPIGDNPLVELLLPIVFVVSYLFWPLPLDAWYQWLNFGVWLAGLVGLAALFVYDARWQLLPDKIVWPLAALAGINVVVQFIAHQPQGDALQTLQFYAYGLLPVTGLYGAIYLFSRGRMVGFGDVKLGVFIGLSLGWPGALLTLVLANFIGALITVPLMFAGKLKRTSRVPFGPFLIIAYVIAGLWGDALIKWYFAGLL